MEHVKLVCRGCEWVEEVQLGIVTGGATISCSSCGALIVETKTTVAQH